LIQQPIAILAYLAVLVALVFQAPRVPALRVVLDRLPAIFWTYFLPMLSTTVGLLPAQSPVYEALARYLLPASLALLLLSSELRSIARLGRTALLIMAAGLFGTALGAVVAFLLFRPWLPAEAWKALGALTGTWTGGSANLVAVATTLDLSPSLQGVIIIVDTVVGYSWMGVLVFLAGHQARLDRWNHADRALVAEVGVHLDQLRAESERPLRVPEATLMVGLALGLTAACLWLGGQLPPVGRVLNPFSWSIVLLTSVALLLSLTRLSRLEGAGASTLGYAGFYLLLASVGAQGDLRKVVEQPQFVAVGVTVIFVHIACVVLALRLLRAPAFFLGAASQACVGGYSSAPIVAALYEPAMAPVGLLLAVLGNVVGTYLGLGVAELLAGLT
jgi:uncharacterized membrane protein